MSLSSHTGLKVSLSWQAVAWPSRDGIDTATQSHVGPTAEPDAFDLSPKWLQGGLVFQELGPEMPLLHQMWTAEPQTFPKVLCCDPQFSAGDQI